MARVWAPVCLCELHGGWLHTACSYAAADPLGATRLTRQPVPDRLSPVAAAAAPATAPASAISIRSYRRTFLTTLRKRSAAGARRAQSRASRPACGRSCQPSGRSLLTSWRPGSGSSSRAAARRAAASAAAPASTAAATASSSGGAPRRRWMHTSSSSSGTTCMMKAARAVAARVAVAAAATRAAAAAVAARRQPAAAAAITAAAGESGWKGVGGVALRRLSRLQPALCLQSCSSGGRTGRHPNLMPHALCVFVTPCAAWPACAPAPPRGLGLQLERQQSCAAAAAASAAEEDA